MQPHSQPTHDDEQVESAAAREAQESQELAPGIPIVRSSTPRPLTLGAMMSSTGQHVRVKQEDGATLPNFPARAPSAPPLPEELGGQGEDLIPVANATGPASHPGKSAFSAESPVEFDWLFEYGLEMDTAILNSSERLDGAALLYGPAVLKGYSIMLGNVGMYGGEEGGGKTMATIMPGPDLTAEVWGVLYRIPRRLRTHMGGEPSPLDVAHNAGAPHSLFRPVQAIVHETHRNRDIECVIYIATDAVRRSLKPLALNAQSGDTLFIQHLAAIARMQGLPDKYLSSYTSYLSRSPQAPLTGSERASRRVGTMTRLEQKEDEHDTDTEPLPALRGIGDMPLPVSVKQPERQEEALSPVPKPSRWLVVFAVYLALNLLLVLTCAVLQGIGIASSVFTNDFTPLGVPWSVLVYGFLGGCISSIVRLGRSRVTNPPVFVVITWFTRPYVGVALAVFSYLFLTSGLFVFSRNIVAYRGLFLLAGALAGLCEGWIFLTPRSGTPCG